jgi:hypothetical protein
MPSKDVVVVRPMEGVFWVKCPLCNTEGSFDKTSNMSSSSVSKCEGCGATYNFQLLAIKPLRNTLDDESFKDDDITMLMSQESPKTEPEAEAPVVVGTQKLTIEKSAFYFGQVTCPYCLQECTVRYNAPQPYPAQWCPTKNCHAELTVVIWVTQSVGGDVSSWYNVKNQTDKGEK